MRAPPPTDWLRRFVVGLYRSVMESPLAGRPLIGELHENTERLDHLYEHRIDWTRRVVRPGIDRPAAAGRMAPYRSTCCSAPWSRPSRGGGRRLWSAGWGAPIPPHQSDSPPRPTRPRPLVVNGLLSTAPDSRS